MKKIVIMEIVIKMKKKISVTIEEDAVESIEHLLEDKMFRNRSHVIEYSLMKFLNKNMTEEGKENEE